MRPRRRPGPDDVEPDGPDVVDELERPLGERLIDGFASLTEEEDDEC